MTIFDRPRRRQIGDSGPIRSVEARVESLESSRSLATKILGAALTLIAGGAAGLYHSAQARGERVGAAMVRLDHLERDVADLRAELRAHLFSAPRAHGDEQ